MSESDTSGQGVYPRVHLLFRTVRVVDHFNDPEIVFVANCEIPVPCDLVILLCDRRSERMRMQISTGCRVNQANHITVVQKFDRSIRVDGIRVPWRCDDPVVVVVFVMVACHLLLLRARGECLDVRVEQTTSISVVLKRQLRAVRDFQGRQGKIVALQMRLEQGGHLRISRSGAVEDEKVDLEACGVDRKGQEDEACYTGNPVLDVCSLESVSYTPHNLQEAHNRH